MNYMTNISFYFALKASESNDVRDHPVIQALFNLRQTLEKLEALEEKLQDEIQDFVTDLEEEQAEEPDAEIEKANKKIKRTKSTKKAVKAAIAQDSDLSDDLQQDDDTEDEQNILNEIQGIEEEFKSLKKAAKKRKRAVVDDFGELDALDELDMEDKLIKKKSIRDYVAKIDSVSICKKIQRSEGFTDDVPQLSRNKPKTPANIRVMLIYHTEIEFDRSVRVLHNLKIHQLIWITMTGMKKMLLLLMKFVTARQTLMMNIMQKLQPTNKQSNVQRRKSMKQKEHLLKAVILKLKVVRSVWHLIRS